MSDGKEEQLAFLLPPLVGRGTNTGVPSTWLPITQKGQAPSGSEWVAVGGPGTQSTSKPDEVFRPLPATETPPT